MKRLWVDSAFRGLHLGRRLAEAAVAWSRAHGSRVLLLDTVPSCMPEAVTLYRSLGFTETERHNDSRVPDLLFMHLKLQKRVCGRVAGSILRRARRAAAGLCLVTNPQWFGRLVSGSLPLSAPAALSSV